MQLKGTEGCFPPPAIVLEKPGYPEYETLCSFAPGGVAGEMDAFIEVQHMKKVTSRLQRRELGYTSAFHADPFAYHEDVKDLYQRDVKWHCGCVNAVELSPTEEFVVSGGDDMRVAMWRIRDLAVAEKPTPAAVMEESHLSNIFALGFSLHTDRIYSAGNDGFFKVHDIRTKQVLREWEESMAYYRLSPHPTDDNMIAVANHNGNVYFYDLRQPDADTKIRLNGIAYSATFNPVYPNLVATCSRGQGGLSVYDIRKTYDYYARAGDFTKRAFYSDWNEAGDGIFCAISQTSPIYFDLRRSEYVKFDDPNYVNVCTVKSCTIAGDYVLCGGDDWNIYAWKIPKPWSTEKVTEAYTVLKGHRSIVNHVRYARTSQMVISCGVEKIIKCWSMYPLTKESYENPRRRLRGNLLDLAAAAQISDFYAETPEEDLRTLYQFDQYYATVRKKREGREDSSDSDSDSDDGYIALDISGMDVDVIHHLFSDSDESMNSQVPDTDETSGGEEDVSEEAGPLNRPPSALSDEPAGPSAAWDSVTSARAVASNPPKRRR